MNFQPISTTEKEATTLLSTQDDQGVAALGFTKVPGYTTFFAEFAFDGNDIVFHFFRTSENASDKYWKEIFPDVLSEVAQEVFQVGYPRLKAAWTQEQDSWWMRAGCFVDVGLPGERVQVFLAKLDQNLEARNVKNLPALRSFSIRHPEESAYQRTYTRKFGQAFRGMGISNWTRTSKASSSASSASSKRVSMFPWISRPALFKEENMSSNHLAALSVAFGGNIRSEYHADPHGRSRS